MLLSLVQTQAFRTQNIRDGHAPATRLSLPREEHMMRSLLPLLLLACARVCGAQVRTSRRRAQGPRGHPRHAHCFFATIKVITRPSPCAVRGARLAVPQADAAEAVKETCAFDGDVVQTEVG